jgi:hypothetical protein
MRNINNKQYYLRKARALNLPVNAGMSLNILYQMVENTKRGGDVVVQVYRQAMNKADPRVLPAWLTTGTYKILEVTEKTHPQCRGKVWVHVKYREVPNANRRRRYRSAV